MRPTWQEVIQFLGRTFQSVTVKVGTVFVLLALIFGAVLLFNSYLTHNLIGASTAINHAGSLRMRVYKFSFLLRAMLPEDRGASEQEMLDHEIQEFERVLLGLRNGEPSLGLLAEQDPEFISRIDQLRAEWEGSLKPSLQTARQARPETRESALGHYYRQVPGFAREVSDLVAAMEQRTSGRVENLYRLQTVFLLSALALAAVTIVILNRIIRDPLRTLTRGVEALDSGTTQPAIPVHTNDELGQLARAFEMMAARVRHHIEHLESLHATIHELAVLGTGGLDQMLRRTADLSASLVQADLAILLIRHPTLECWMVEAASGPLFDVLRKQIVLIEETPYANQAFDLKQPVTVPYPVESGEFRSPFLEKLHTQSALLVPLFTPHESIGVLMLLNTTRARTFTEREIRLAQQSATYVAIAIENARLFEMAESESRTLREKVKAVEHKVAELTHEVKAPAGRVAEFASWIERDYGMHLDEKGLRYLQWIKKEGKDLAQLAERTLNLARMFEEPTPVECVDADAVVREVVDLLMKDCAAKNIHIEMADRLPQFACRRIHLKQILENLISNAIKFMGDHPAPLIQIGTELDERGIPWLYVRDNGVGIEEEMLERIFEPFQRVGTIEAPGAGIGLTIVKAVAEHYGGTVKVRSKLGAGSTFLVQLPVLSDRSSLKR